jgi:hypothetical protein
MQNPVWRPDDEAAATSTMTAFIEWRRATASHAPGGPAAIWAWAAAEPAEFAVAIGRFAGLDSGFGYAETLARAMTPHGRIVLLGAGGRRCIGAAALRRGELPGCIAVMLKAGDCDAVTLKAGNCDALARQAADHLLRLELRADQRLLWPGPLDDPWPLGALLAVGTLLLCETPPADPAGLAAAEGAVLLRRPV